LKRVVTFTPRRGRRRNFGFVQPSGETEEKGYRDRCGKRRGGKILR